MADKPQHRGFHPIYLLLVLPFVALLWVPLYNRLEPAIFGNPILLLVSDAVDLPGHGLHHPCLSL